MKNSFAKEYTKDVRPDGSIALTFKSQRFGARHATLAILALLFVLMPVSCAGTYPLFKSSLYEVTSFTAPGGRPQVLPALMWTIVSASIAAIVFIRLMKTTTTIVVVPDQGITFHGNSIPFPDIQRIGTVTEQSANANPIAYVSVDTRGNEVRVGGYTKPSLADAIAQELRAASGKSWR